MSTTNSGSSIATTIAGYRVLRRLGVGSRSTVYLGSPVRSDADCVALKLFDAHANALSISREIGAHSGAPAVHVPALFDVATLPDGRVVLVLERVSSESVGAMLRDCQTISAGEAVTVIAPLVAALAALHDSGLVHTTLSLGTVALTAAGRPVLMGLGSLADLPPIRGQRGPERDRLHRLDLQRADYTRLTAVMRAVFTYLDNDVELHRRSEPIAAWFEMATTAIPFRPCLDELEQRLFEWSQGAPLRLVQPSTPQVRDDPAASVRAGVRPERWGGLGGVFADLLPEIGNGGGVADADGDGSQRGWLASAMPGWAARLRAGLRAWLGARRRPLIVASVLSVALTVMLLTLVHTEGETSAEPGRAAVAPDTTQGVPLDAGATGGADADADADAIVADEPVAAAAALLRRRAQCIQDEALECLAAVDQAGSALWDADSYGIRHGQQVASAEEAVLLADSAVTLVERTGDAAIIALSPSAGTPERKPASLLVIRGEAGWRLRELFD